MKKKEGGINFFFYFLWGWSVFFNSIISFKEAQARRKKVARVYLRGVPRGSGSPAGQSAGCWSLGLGTWWRPVRSSASPESPAGSRSASVPSPGSARPPSPAPAGGTPAKQQQRRTAIIVITFAITFHPQQYEKKKNSLVSRIHTLLDSGENKYVFTGSTIFQARNVSVFQCQGVYLWTEISDKLKLSHCWLIKDDVNVLKIVMYNDQNWT